MAAIFWALTLSVTAKLAGLVAIAAALPLLLYVHFERIYDRNQALVIEALKERDVAFAQLFSPLLTVEPLPEGAIRELLLGFTDAKTRRWLLHTPLDVRNADGVQIAALSSWIPSQSDMSLDETYRREVMARLPDTCIRGESRNIFRAEVSASTLVSFVPITVPHGCWLLVSTALAPAGIGPSLGGSYWEKQEVRVAAVLYALMVALMALAVAGIAGRLKQFRDIAYDVGQYRTVVKGGSSRIVMKELSGAAEVLDGLVLDVQRISNQIRKAAGDNAHSLKTPLAVIRVAVARVRRHSPADQEAVNRALNAADQAIDRLFLLVTATQRLDDDNAALIVAPRQLMNLTQLIDDARLQFRDMLASRDIRLVCRLAPDVRVRAGAGNLETVLRNTIDNAINASPDGSTIFITLEQQADFARLQIDDAGNSIGPDDVARVFERDFSTQTSDSRSNEKPKSDHVRPGLFVVKRNIEALGGQVVAQNSAEGALSVIITLPRPRR